MKNLLSSCLASLLLSACATQPLFESYAREPDSSVLPPADAVQYFLPRRLVSVTVQRTRTHRDTVTVRVLPPVPDLERSYYLRAPRPAWRDATANLRTTASGLLSSVGATSKDESPAILADAASLAALVPEIAAEASVSGLAAPEALAARKPRPVPAPVTCGALGGGLAGGNGAPGAFKATVVFDPVRPDEIARAQAELCTRGAHYRLVVLPLMAPPPADVRAAAVADADCHGAALSGLHCEPVVYYRRDQPFMLSIYDGGDTAGPGYTLVSAVLIQVPNGAPRERLAIAAAPAVSTRGSAGFADGMLVSSSFTAPSPARAIAQVPLDLARAIVAIPSALFQFRIDSTRDAARLTEAQTEAIKAQTAQLNAIAALRAREAPPAPDASDSVEASAAEAHSNEPP